MVLRPTFEKQRYVRPWRLCVTIDVLDDSLAEGDTVTLTLGDRSGGSRGIRAQTFCQESFEFRVAVDWCGTWVYERIPSPQVPITSGTAHKLVVVAPSETIAGEETWVGVKAEDVWGNPSREYTEQVRIEGRRLEGLPETYKFVPEDEEGVMQAESNPLLCLMVGRKFQPFWGDLHGQSEETVGTNPVSSYFRFARESTLVNFAGHQGNDFQITKEVWQEIRQQANRQNDPGHFVAYVGWE